jgi:hypothetical protein
MGCDQAQCALSGAARRRPRNARVHSRRRLRYALEWTERQEPRRLLRHHDSLRQGSRWRRGGKREYRCALAPQTTRRAIGSAERPARCPDGPMSVRRRFVGRSRAPPPGTACRGIAMSPALRCIASPNGGPLPGNWTIRNQSDCSPSAARYLPQPPTPYPQGPQQQAWRTPLPETGHPRPRRQAPESPRGKLDKSGKARAEATLLPVRSANAA